MDIRKKVESAMYGREHSLPVWMLAGLSGVASLYGFLVRLRKAAYKSGLFSTLRLPCFVISVGNITLGGTGKESGDRHPKVGDGVLISAGAKILGNIRVGEGAKVGAGSVVLDNVPPHVTVAGVPAKVVGKDLHLERLAVQGHRGQAQGNPRHQHHPVPEERLPRVCR